MSVWTAVAAEAAEVTPKIAALIIRFPPSQHGPRMTIIIIALISSGGPGERRDTSHGSRATQGRRLASSGAQQQSGLNPQLQRTAVHQTAAVPSPGLLSRFSYAARNVYNEAAGRAAAGESGVANCFSGKN